MHAHEITLLKASFRRIVPIADQAAALFYARLFELQPLLRAEFQGDMGEQGRALMAAIAHGIAQLDDRARNGLPPATLPAPALALRHAATLREALLWTLEKGLGAEFTLAVRDAWAHALEHLGVPSSPATFSAA